jgi:hypothetical protein
LVPENNRYDVDVSSTSFLFKGKQEAKLVGFNVVP